MNKQKEVFKIIKQIVEKYKTKKMTKLAVESYIQNIKNKVVAILKRRGVKRAAIFGSSVRGEAKENSDIDILIEFKGEKSLLDLIGLKFELEDVLGKKVDILTYNSLHPLLRDRILNEQKVIL